MDKWLILLVAIGFGFARFVVPVTGKLNKSDIFKDMAHLTVGFMFGYAAYAGNDLALWAIPAVLTVVEVVAFVVRKGG